MHIKVNYLLLLILILIFFDRIKSEKVSKAGKYFKIRKNINGGAI